MNHTVNHLEERKKWSLWTTDQSCLCTTSILLHYFLQVSITQRAALWVKPHLGSLQSSARTMKLFVQVLRVLVHSKEVPKEHRSKNSRPVNPTCSVSGSSTIQSLNKVLLPSLCTSNPLTGCQLRQDFQCKLAEYLQKLTVQFILTRPNTPPFWNPRCRGVCVVLYDDREPKKNHLCCILLLLKHHASFLGQWTSWMGPAELQTVAAWF